MIPLMFIQKKENLLALTTAAITKMGAHYSHLREAIEIEVKLNLDAFFNIVVKLNEFDAPKYVYIKSLTTSEYIKVTPEVKKYTIEGRREVVVLTYDNIINIATNNLTYDEVEKWDIKTKMLNPSKDPDVKMTEFEYRKDSLRFKVNNNFYEYRMDKTMPVLIQGLGQPIKPRTVIGNYYIYDVQFEDNGPVYSIALMHIRSFKNHYLFRQTKRTHKMRLVGDTIYDTFHDEYFFNDGMISIDNRNNSVQKFLNHQYDHEYKQYFFNAIRDKNLYTEIANTFNILKHNSFMVYDFTNDERLIGKADAYLEYNKNSTPEIVINLTNVRNQFGDERDYTFTFRAPIYNIYNILSNCHENYRLIDYGYFLVNNQFVTVSTNIVNEEQENYVTASNKKWFFSISLNYIDLIADNSTKSTIPILKVLDEDVFIPNIYNLKKIDFLNKEVSLINVFKEINIPFKSIDASPYVIATPDAKMFGDSFTEGFGLKFKIKPNSITFNPITPDRFNQVVLMIKTVEDDEYLLDDIIDDTAHLSNSVVVNLADRNLLMVLNNVKKYVYYIDLNNQDISRDFASVDSFAAFIEVENEDILKNILYEKSVKAYLVKNNGYGVNVDHQLNVKPYMVYKDIDRTFFSTEKGIVPNVETNEGYTIRNKQLKATFGYTDDTYKEVFRGVFRNSDYVIESMDLKDGKLNIHGTYNSSKKDYTISIDSKGVFRCFDVFGKEVTKDFDKKIFNDSYGVMTFDDCIGLDLNIINEYMKNNNLALDGRAFVGLDNESFYIKTDSLTNISTEIKADFSESQYIAVENWLGDELFGIISLEYLDESPIDCYYECNVSKTDDATIYKIPVDLSKYIVKY